MMTSNENKALPEGGRASYRSSEKNSAPINMHRYDDAPMTAEIGTTPSFSSTSFHFHAP
jgi:hypothetical protein